MVLGFGGNIFSELEGVKYKKMQL